jgi:hypothetical protein
MVLDVEIVRVVRAENDNDPAAPISTLEVCCDSQTQILPIETALRWEDYGGAKFHVVFEGQKQQVILGLRAIRRGTTTIILPANDILDLATRPS